MSTSVSNISKWTTNTSWPFLWPFLWPFYSYPPLPHEFIHEITMSSPWKSPWAHPGNHHELTLEIAMTPPGNRHELTLEKPPTTRVFFQQDLSTGYTYQPKKTNLPTQLSNLTHNFLSSERTVWTVWTVWTTPKINPHRNTQ